MNGLLAYSGITTKVKAMQSTILTTADYNEITSLRSVQEFVDYLKRHPYYQKHFQSVDDSTLHRGDVEVMLKRTILQDFRKIYLFSDQEQRHFMDLYFLRYEVTSLKSCLRSVFDNRNIELDLSRYQEFYNKHASIDVARLAACNTTNDLISALKGTIYHDCLSKLEHLTHPTLFDYETALDIFYFNHFWKSVHKLYSSKQLSILLDTAGSKIDMLNIQWIYRSKKYYKMTPADIYALVIPIQYHLKKSDISAMVEAEHLNDMVAAIQNTYYARLFEEADITTLEKMYRTVLNKIYQETARKYPYSIACINTYLYQREREIDCLTSVLEGIRYALPADRIMRIIS